MGVGLPSDAASPGLRRMRARRLAWWGVGCSLLSAAILAGIPVLFGVPDRMIHVTWRGIDDAARVSIERRLSLSEAAKLRDGRWSYVPRDTRPETLRALVDHPAVSATDGIERDTAALAARGPLTARRGGWLAAPPMAPRAARLAGYLFAVAACAFLLLAAAWWKGLTSATARRLVQSGLASARASIRRCANALSAATNQLWAQRPTRATLRAAAGAAQRGVPIISADAAGLFRIAFGSVVLACVMLEPMEPAHLNGYDVGGAQGVYGTFIGWLAREPAAVQSLGSWLLAFGSLFIAGVATGVSYLAFVLAFLTWASVRALARSHHVVSAITIAMICLLPARWGDAWSVDAWLRRRVWGRSPGAPSRRYGFAPWMLTVVLGVAFFAAAVSKLREGGTWILNGTVKYHFVTDLHQALVPWGPALTSNHAVAVGLSLAAVLVEAWIVTAVFTRSVSYRAACGLGSLALLAGFWLFQGVFWPGWWILLLGFLPWQWIRDRGTAASGGSLSVIQGALVAALVFQQCYASWTRLEARPFISAYDMYSTTYASPAAYEAAGNLRYRVVGITDRGSVELPDCEVDEPGARLFAAAAAGGTVERERIRGLIGRCVADRPEVTMVGLEGDKEVYDWDTRRFEWKRGLDRIGPVTAHWLRTEPSAVTHR